MLTWALYTAPALVMLGLTLARRDRSVPARWIDWLPGVYVLYVFASIALTTDLLESNVTGTAKAFVLFVAIGSIVYYFLIFGPGRERSRDDHRDPPRERPIAEVLAVLDSSIGWNVWGYDGWQHVSGGASAVGPDQSGPRRRFLGATMAVAVAVLVWDGPRSLRQLSWIPRSSPRPRACCSLSPADPILMTALALVLLLLIGRARIVGLAVLAVGAIAIRAPPAEPEGHRGVRRAWPTRSTSRAGRPSRTGRSDSPRRNPVFGWGYGSFDRAKNIGLLRRGLPIKNVLEYTSHSTYLTVLVELGGLGLVIFWEASASSAPGALVRARAAFEYRWLVGGALGALLVLFLTASTIDFRFFSIAQMLPFLFLAILRRIAATSAAPSRRRHGSAAPEHERRGSCSSTRA